VVSLGVVNGEERFDGNVAPHPHLVCRFCGRVADLPCLDSRTFYGFSAMGNKILRNASGRERFRVDFRRTVFYGACGGCTQGFSLESRKGLHQAFI
jgi:Fur family peroxide stress response transcriptional regulator